MITSDKFLELGDVHKLHCISLYMPTHRAGEEVKKKTDQTRFKSLIEKAKRRLEEDFGLAEQDALKLLEPTDKLLKDSNFWSHMDNGFAVFLDPDGVYYERLPYSFEEELYIGDHYYLKPLVPLLNKDGEFYLLTLSAKNVKLYLGDFYSMEEVALGDRVPQSMEAILEGDPDDNALQTRGAPEGGHSNMPHGHGSGGEEDEQDLLKFFREVDHGLMEILHDERAPLVLACVDYYHPLFKDTSHYKYLQEDFIRGNPDGMDPQELHEQAWAIAEPRFTKDRVDRKATFNDLFGKGKASDDLRDIVPAAIDGRVESVFIKRDAKVFGLYNKNDHRVELYEDVRPEYTDLLNLAAVHSLKNHGMVYLEDGPDMPEKDATCNAILRY